MGEERLGVKRGKQRWRPEPDQSQGQRDRQLGGQKDRDGKEQTKSRDRETYKKKKKKKQPAKEAGWKSKDGRQTMAVERFVRRDVAERQGRPDPADRRLPKTLSKGVSLPTTQGWQTGETVPTPLPGSLARARCNSHRLEPIFPSGVPQSQAEAITPILGAIPVPS